MLGHIREISEKSIWLAGKAEPRSCIPLTCFTVFSSESFFALVLSRAFQTLFISSFFCLSSPKGWRLQRWALPVAAAEGSRGFCSCFQRETATVVRVRCHSSWPGAYPALCITWKLWPFLVLCQVRNCSIWETSTLRLLVATTKKAESLDREWKDRLKSITS